MNVGDMLYEVINEWVKRWANECVREIMNNWYKMRHWIKTLMIEVLNEKRNTWVNEWRNERVRELIYAYVYERIRDVSIMYLFTKPVPPRLFYLIYFFWRKWSHKLRPKKLHASVAVPAAPVRVPSQRPLAPSVPSVTSVADDKSDNEMILGSVHRSPGICLTAEENKKLWNLLNWRIH